jgi:predicted metal-binding membrane protein
MVNTALAPFLSTWTPMMAVMMLPSAAPMILLHRRGVGGPGRIQSELRTAIFVGAYLLVWAAAGIGVWIGARITDALLPVPARALGVAAILLLAGVYQFTPLKSACLRVCRSPMDFLLTHWYPGLSGELRLGLEHGIYCLGCCWALMAVFAGAGAMGLVWAAIIALVVFAEKALPRGLAVGRVMGTGLIGAAALVAARPEIAQSLAGKM